MAESPEHQPHAPPFPLTPKSHAWVQSLGLYGLAVFGNLSPDSPLTWCADPVCEDGLIRKTNHPPRQLLPRKSPSCSWVHPTHEPLSHQLSNTLPAEWR